MADKRTKEERETEFIDAVEQALGCPLLPYQREEILNIRDLSLKGRVINIEGIKTRRLSRG